MDSSQPVTKSDTNLVTKLLHENVVWILTSAVGLPPPEHWRLRGGVLSAQAGLTKEKGATFGSPQTAFEDLNLPGLQGLFGLGLRYFEARPPPPGHSHLGLPCKSKVG